MGPSPVPSQSSREGLLDGTGTLVDFSFSKSTDVTFAYARCSSRALSSRIGSQSGGLLTEGSLKR